MLLKFCNIKLVSEFPLNKKEKIGNKIPKLDWSRRTRKKSITMFNLAFILFL